MPAFAHTHTHTHINTHRQTDRQTDRHTHTIIIPAHSLSLSVRERQGGRQRKGEG